jgi:hypothetical protein
VARVARIEPREAPALLKSGSPRAPRLTARLGYLHQSRSIESGCSTLLVWNATSDAVRGGSGCPFAPTMQHSGAADGSASSAVSQDPVRSKHDEQCRRRRPDCRSWCDSAVPRATVKTAASGYQRQPSPYRLLFSEPYPCASEHRVASAISLERQGT